MIDTGFEGQDGIHITFSFGEKGSATAILYTWHPECRNCTFRDCEDCTTKFEKPCNYSVATQRYPEGIHTEDRFGNFADAFDSFSNIVKTLTKEHDMKG